MLSVLKCTGKGESFASVRAELAKEEGSKISEGIALVTQGPEDMTESAFLITGLELDELQ